ncbi:hypothetical protein ACEQ8H_008606 [Pleosporales sp. CAS-2024a]
MKIQFFRRFPALVLLASIFCFIANGQTSESDAVALLAKIPACALTCIGESLPAIGCGLTDTECQCNSKNSTAILQPCLERECQYEQIFDLLHIQAQLCNRPHNSRGNILKVTAYVTGIIPIIAILLRFMSRHLGGNKFWWDDWIHLVAVILVVSISRWTYIMTFFWAIQLLLLKYSILCLYLRIFPNVWLKRAVYAFMAFSACFTLPLIGLATFQCIPISAVWELKERANAKCINWIAVLRLTVVYEIIAECVLFSLPVPIVLKLQMETGKKIQLLAFFGLGVCVIGIAIARVPFLPGVTDTVDQTYTVMMTSFTGYLASAVAHICATVPALRNLIRFCMNGFKKAPTYAQPASTGTGYTSKPGKRSYKSLSNDKKLASAQHASKGSSRISKDPYSIHSVVGLDEEAFVVELGPVDDPAYTAAAAAAPPPAEDGMVEHGKQHPVMMIRASPSPDLDDSASNKTILQKDPYV